MPGRKNLFKEAFTYKCNESIRWAMVWFGSNFERMLAVEMGGVVVVGAV